MFGAIEAGGTKIVVAIGDHKTYEIKDRQEFPTTTPQETVQKIIDYFTPYKQSLKGIGIGSFGPVDINPKSATYGRILNTPKLAWKQFDLLHSLKEKLDIPMAITTDVNASLLGEMRLGAGKDIDSGVYYTIGTGVGAGAMQHGQLIGGFSHPEMGHQVLNIEKDDHFKGHCSYHGHCLEGMVAGPAIEARVGKSAKELAKDDPVWELVARYIAQGLYNTTLILSPERFILGGGVMKQMHLFTLIRQAFSELNAGYFDVPHLEDYIVPPELEDNQAIIGCFILIEEAMNDEIRIPKRF